MLTQSVILEVNSQQYCVEIEIDPVIEGAGTCHGVDVFESDDLDHTGSQKVWYCAGTFYEEDEALQEAIENENLKGANNERGR